MAGLLSVGSLGRKGISGRGHLNKPGKHVVAQSSKPREVQRRMVKEGWCAGYTAQVSVAGWMEPRVRWPAGSCLQGRGRP